MGHWFTMSMRESVSGKILHCWHPVNRGVLSDSINHEPKSYSVFIRRITSRFTKEWLGVRRERVEGGGLSDALERGGSQKYML